MNAYICATAIVPSTADIAALALAAGGKPENTRYDLATGELAIDWVEQSALDAVLGQVDPLFSRRYEIKTAAAAEQAKRLDAGLPFRGKVADIDGQTTLNMTAVASMIQAGVVTDAISWRMKDNTAINLDPPSVMVLVSLVFAYVNSLRQHYWSLVDAAKTAPDEAALDAIDVTAGWPEPPVDPNL